MMSDDAGFNNFGFTANLFGGEQVGETPNLDALASQSTVLKQGYVAASLCGTSRAGLLTGQYGQRFGYEENLGNANGPAGTAQFGLKGLSEDQITIAQRLKGLGYSTGAIGKWHLGYADNYNLPLDKGFDEFFGFWGGDRQYFQSCCAASSMRRGDVNVEAQWRNEGDTSRYDPVKGRYSTDAFGEEAVSFINNHAHDEDPFFLYVAFNAPHTPYDAKQSDLARFAHLADISQQYQAAMVYAMDRAVGDIVGSLESNQIDDDTIVVFMNDNGPLVNLWPYSLPFRGWKGTAYEGGIRVPFTIKLPGNAPGIYDSPVTALDLMPTLYAAAGGDETQIPTDGYNMLPYLRGEATDDPNKVLFWRAIDTFAVRKGDWKLSIAYTPNSPGAFLFNLAEHPQENFYYNASNAPMVAELTRELTYWEAEMQKAKWGALGVDDKNNFDRFVFRNDLAATTKWSAGSAWKQGGTANNATLTPIDAYANAILEFTVRNDADYTATNDMKRMTRETFMLNEIRLAGSFTGAADRQATINGNSVLLVKNLSGGLPQIRLDATASGTPAGFKFQIDNEIQLLHDLEITGNGTQNFVVNGRIRDYYEPLQPLVISPHSVRKSGSSTVTLKGDNTFTGSLTVDEGSVTISGATAAISGAQGIDIRSAGSVTLESGTIAVNWIKNAVGGSFHFNGGLLKVVDVTGNLANNGGIYSPGASPAVSSVTGNLTQAAGTFLIELGGATMGQYDSVFVGGAATIGSTLDVNLVNGFTPSRGQTFKFLTAAGGISGMFATNTLPLLPGGLTWNLVYNSNVSALVIGGAGGIGNHLPGDFNQDGTVDAADYSVWRDSTSSGSLVADGNADGIINATDYQIWKSSFGLYLNSGSGGFAVSAIPGVPELSNSTAVPEPTALAIALLGSIMVLFPERRR